MRFECWNARLVTAVAIAFVPASLCAAQTGLVPGHQKNGSPPDSFSRMLDGVDYSGRGVIPLGDLGGDGVEVLRVGATARIGPGLLEPTDGRDRWVLKIPATSPSPRRVPGAMAYDSARGVTVLFGGYDGALNDETWEWDGVNWTQRFVSPRPSPRVTIAMAYDSARAVTVLFGGVTPTGLSNETWEWDGASWALRSSTGPAPRQWHAMAYDSFRGVTVLFGGNLGGAPGGLPTDDTWEWDGVSWTSRGGPHPPARFGHAMAYDLVRAEVILFGGRDPVIGLYDDTWALGTGGWTPVATPTRPSPRHAHAMVGVPGIPGVPGAPGGVLLFGGILEAGRSDETWGWIGTGWWTGWYLRRIATAPSRRGTHGMARDSARRQIVVFGGDDGSSILNDTWEIWSSVCPCSCDFDPDPVCDIFDFLAFQSAFVAGHPCACEFDPDPACNIFDFLAFQNKMFGHCL